MPIIEKELESTIEKLYAKRNEIDAQVNDISHCINALESIKKIKVVKESQKPNERPEVTFEQPTDRNLGAPMKDNRRQEICDDAMIKAKKLLK